MRCQVTLGATGRRVGVVRVIKQALLVAIGCLTIGLTMACGSAARDTRTSGSIASGSPTRTTVRVSGAVARSCPGTIIVGQPPRCSDRAVFTRGHKHVTVRGKFVVRLTPGTYHVTVDSCAHDQTLRIKRAVSGLKLVPHCPLPL
jgi:hypothetical protein